MKPQPYRRKYIPAERPKGYNPNFSKYDAMQARWIAQNPAYGTHTEEYKEAMRVIASVCGI